MQASHICIASWSNNVSNLTGLLHCTKRIKMTATQWSCSLRLSQLCLSRDSSSSAAVSTATLQWGSHKCSSHRECVWFSGWTTVTSSHSLHTRLNGAVICLILSSHIEMIKIVQPEFVHPLFLKDFKCCHPSILKPNEEKQTITATGKT